MIDLWDSSKPIPPHVTAKADQLIAATRDQGNHTVVVDELLAAVVECQIIWPYNAVAMEDQAVSSAVRFLLGKMQEGWNGVPDVRVIYPTPLRVGTEEVATPLYSEVINNRDEWMQSYRKVAISGWCGRCSTERRTVSILYVPVGCSIVGLELCGPCHVHMMHNFGPLVWMG